MYNIIITLDIAVNLRIQSKILPFYIVRKLSYKELISFIKFIVECE
jgi:hypothetical protein